MPAVVAPPPWVNAFKAQRKNKSQFKQYKGFSVSYEKRLLINELTGEKYPMPAQDNVEFVKFYRKHQSELSQGYLNGKKLKRNILTPTDFIDYAFETKSQKNNQLVSVDCKGGHIVKLTYNALYKLLMVQFAYSYNLPNVCVFFNLPANVAALLMHLGETGQMAAPEITKTGIVRERHAVGVEFWNLVRVRGTKHTTRYPFEYTNGFTTGRKPSDKHPQNKKWIYLNKEKAERLGVSTADKRYKDYDAVDAKQRSTAIRLSKDEYEKLNAEQQMADEADMISDIISKEVSTDDFMTRRADLRAQIREANKNGDTKLAEKLQEELDSIHPETVAELITRVSSTMQNAETRIKKSVASCRKANANLTTADITTYFDNGAYSYDSSHTGNDYDQEEYLMDAFEAYDDDENIESIIDLLSKAKIDVKYSIEKHNGYRY